MGALRMASGGNRLGQTSVRESPDMPLYFFSLAEPKNSAIVVTVREHIVLWEVGTGYRFYPALFVIRTPTVNRKLIDCGARS